MYIAIYVLCVISDGLSKDLSRLDEEHGVLNQSNRNYGSHLPTITYVASISDNKTNESNNNFMGYVDTNIIH